MSNGVKWLLAVVLTVSAAIYQRVTGPTYPIKVKVTIHETVYKFKFPRSHAGFSPQTIQLAIPDTSVHAELHYRRFKVDKDWMVVPMSRQNGLLKGELPAQPPAGKLEYFVRLNDGQQQITLPEKNAVVIRFKGKVPLYVLIPHVLFMFLSMLLAMYCFFEALTEGERLKTFTLLTSAVLFLGGMILGPLVQKFAFGALWTGIPFGWDLTDNKTLIALIFWLIASWQVWRKGTTKAKYWVIVAVVVMFVVYLIPHSVMGSEFNYQTMQVETGKL